MNRLLWAGLGLLPLSFLLLIARHVLCISGGYFYSINIKCFSTFGAAITLTVVVALLLIAVGCVAKILQRSRD